MDQAEVKRWAQAADLLDKVLENPEDQQHSTAEFLGTRTGCRDEILQLLAAARDESLLDGTLETLIQDMPTAAPEVNEFKGQQIGNWLLGEEIGRGGMSVVYHAERVGQDFKQIAALKILSVGHLDDGFVSGFMRERQILSDLHHPGIASLIDGGITPAGTPYLVMQFVEGQPIDLWCESRHADLKLVARLMIQLCAAVAYQQKHLVVHQDINPANVLVDEHGTPIVIDFGIASLLGPASAEKTVKAFTPRFAAPEQRTGDAITTATDVYALGQLFLTLAESFELDTELKRILEIATQEDPELRYVNVRQLETDLIAWREKRPLMVQPSTTGYRFKRFVDRNRLGVAAAGLVTFSLLAGLGVSIWQANIAATERDTARLESQRASQVTHFLKSLFLASDPDRSMGEPLSARQLLDQGAHQARTAFSEVPALKVEMLVLVGSLYGELGEIDAANSILEEALLLAEELADLQLHVNTLTELARVRMEQGEHESAIELVETAQQQLTDGNKVPGKLHAALMEPMLFSLTELGRAEESVERGREALAKARSASALEPEVMYGYLHALSTSLLVAEQLAEAKELLLESIALDFEAMEDPSVQISLHSTLASVYNREGNLMLSLEHDLQAAELARQIYSPIHSERARVFSNLGSTYSALGRYPEAEEALLESISIYEELYPGRVYPRVASAYNNLASMWRRKGDYQAALPYAEKTRVLAEELFGRDDPRFAISTGNLGDLHRRMGNYDQAESLLLEYLSLRRSIHGSEHQGVGIAMSLLAQLRVAQEQYGDALALTREANSLFDRLDYQSPRVRIATHSREAQALAGMGQVTEARTAFDAAFVIANEAGESGGASRDELEAAFAEFETVHPKNQ